MGGEDPIPMQDSVKDGLESTTKKESDQQMNPQPSSMPDSEAEVKDDDSLPVTHAESKVQSTEVEVPINSSADNEARLQQLEKEHETLRSQYMRIAADFDNFRKRQSRDQDDLRLQLTCTTLSEILPVVDNFERARQQLDPEGEEAQALHRSYQGLYKQLVEVLKQQGVAPMRVIGQAFDPSLHEAVMREPSEEHAEEIILEELQRGYHLNGRVLRHAMVKVSMGPGSTGEVVDKSAEKSKDVALSEDQVTPSDEV